MFKIAVYCGGGIKGFTESTFSRHMKIEADMYAGTSIGGIIACARAAGKSWTETTKLFESKGEFIFKKSSLFRLLRYGHKYKNKGLHRALDNFFGDLKMTDLSPVCITAMGINKDNYGPHFFSERSSDFVVDVCMATSAAPSYFKTYNGYIDGGVFMNNPVFYAYLKAKRDHPDERIKIINIGSGESALDFGKPNNGLDLISNVIQNMMNGNEMAAREMIEEFSDVLNVEYEYYDFKYSEPVALDSIDKFEVMKDAAYAEYVRSNNDKL